MDGLIDYTVEADAEQVVYHALALPDEPEQRGRAASRDALAAARGAPRGDPRHS